MKGPGDVAFAFIGTDNTPNATTDFSVGVGGGDGQYAFYTIAYDLAGNIEAAPAGGDTTTLVDTTPPESSASSPAYSTSTTFTVTYSASDPGSDPSGVEDVELWVKTPGAAAFTKVATDTGAGLDGNFSFIGTVDGSYEVYTRAHDVAGNYEAAPASADDSTLVDTRLPTSSATSPAYSTSTTITVNYTASDPLKDGSASGLAKVEL